MVEADGPPPRAWVYLMFLPVKGEFFIATVAKLLVQGGSLLCNLIEGINTWKYSGKYT